MRYRSSKRAKALAISSEVKDKVWVRDGGRCVFCGGLGLPEAHFISRAKGGLGIEENILTLCRPHHDLFDHGTKDQREKMKSFFRNYLQSKYPDWDESKLIYRRYS